MTGNLTIGFRQKLVIARFAVAGVGVPDRF